VQDLGSLFNPYYFILTMDNKGADGEHAPKEVISVTGRKINPGYEKDYDDWLRRYMVLE
jgi:hypothetical protein